MAYDFDNQDPNEIIGLVIMGKTAQLEEKGIELELNLDEDVGECRLAADRFTQVLTSVVDNAIKYTANNGRIILGSRRSDPFPGSTIPTLLVTVEDTGIGIAPENLDKVFSKFEMVESVKNHTAGTGLSMAICKQIIEDGHNGAIWLESELGKGTKVFIRIPVS